MNILATSIYPYICFLLFFALPFDDYFRALPNLLLIALAVLFPFVIKRSELKNWHKSPALWVLLFLLFVIGQTWFLGRWEQDFVVLKKILLAAGLALLLVPVRESRTLHHGIIYSSIAAIIYSMVRLVMLLNDGLEVSFLASASIIEALLMDRIYLGLLAVLSVIVSYRHLHKTYHPNNGYYLANIILQLCFVLFIVSRIAIVVLLVCFVLSLFYRQKRGPQLLFFGGILGLVLSLAFVLNNDLRNQFFYNNNPEHQEGLLANTTALEPRMVIWDCAWRLTDDPAVIWQGIGYTQTNVQMLACYSEHITNKIKREWFLTRKYNVHNQFLSLYLGSGMVAFVLFALSILAIFWLHKNALFPMALGVTMVVFLLAENVFHRQIGAYYMGLLWALLLFMPAPQKDHDV